MISKDKTVLDTLAPTLIKSSPSINNAPSNTNIVFTFNEKIKFGTGLVTIESSSDKRTMTITDKQVKISGTTLTINPSVDLNINSNYKVHLDAGAIRDLAPVSNLASSIDLSFTTKTSGDKQPPVLQSLLGKGAVSDNLQLTFQENIKIGKGNFTLVNKADSRDKIVIDVTNKAVSVANNVLTINPTQNFKPEATYILTAPKGIVTDLAKNSFAGLTTKAPFKFDTHDTTAPELTISGEKATATNSSIVYTFEASEAIKDFTADDITVNGGTKGDFKAVAGTNNYTLSVTPTANSTTPVTVNVAATKFTDLVGNTNIAALQNIQAVDTVLPTLIISGENATATNSPILYTFTASEAIRDFTVDDITVTAGTKGEFKPVTGTNNFTLSVSPDANSTTPVTVNVTAGKFTDLVNNANVATVQSVQVIDTKAPLLTTISPLNTSINVVKDSNIVLIFDESITASTGNITISNGTDTRIISIKDSTQVSINGNLLTINPTNDLLENSNYTVTFASGVIADSLGNAFAGLTSHFKTVAPITANDVVLTSKAIDGYLKSANVYADANGNGKQDADEASATTDANGTFKLINAKGGIVVSGGIDLSTGKAFAGTLKAPAGSKVVTPLTTLQQGFIEAGQTPAQAGQSVAKAFGFDASKVDLTTYDPIAEVVKAGATGVTSSIAAQMMASSAQIANFLVTAGQVLQGAAGGSVNLSKQNAGDALIKSLVSAISNDAKTGDGVINLGDAALLKSVLVEGAKEANAQAQKEAQATGTTAPKFDAANFTDKIDKMADTVTAVLKSAADNIVTAVNNSKGVDALALLSNMDKVSAFAQNDARASLQKIATTLDTKNIASLTTALKSQSDLFTGDAATKSIESKVVETQKAVADVVAADKIAADKAAADKIAADKAAADKIAADKAAADKIAADKAAADKIAADKAAADKIAADKAVADKIAADKAVADKIAADKAVADKIAADKAAADKIAADKAAADKIAADKAAADKIAADKEVADKIAADKAAADKIAADKEAADKIAADKEVADKIAADKATADKIAADKATADKIAADKEVADKIAADKATADKIAADKEAADKIAADKEVADKIAADKATADKIAADK
ncbi:MAG: hypothetical protein RLZZ66_17, partial [Pseudomonadota bacterium]